MYRTTSWFTESELTIFIITVFPYMRKGDGVSVKEFNDKPSNKYVRSQTQ